MLTLFERMAAKARGEITYAKVGGPPRNWSRLQVRDLDTGRLVDHVVEVNTREGWCKISTIIGRILHETRLFGRFAIERQP